MSLQKVIYPLIVDGGINTKTDDKLVGPGENLILENVEYNEIGAINKRNGFDILDDDTSSGDLLSDLNPKYLLEHNNELMVVGRSGRRDIYSYDTQVPIWRRKVNISSGSVNTFGQHTSPMVFVDDKIADLENSFNPCVIDVYSIDYRFIAYKTYNENLTSPNYKIKVYREQISTRQKTLIYTLSSSSSIIGPQIRVPDVANTHIYLIYSIVVGANCQLKFVKLDLNGQVIASIDLSTYPTATGQQGFTSCLVGTNIFVISDKNNTSTVNARLFDSAGTQLDTEDLALSKTLVAASENCYSTSIVGTKVYVAFRNSDVASPVTFYCLDTVGNTLTISIGEKFFGAGVGVLAKKVIIHAGSSQIFILFEVGGVNFFNCGIYLSYSPILTGIETSNSIWDQGFNLVSSIFTIDSSGDFYFIAQSGIINYERYYICKVSGITGYIYINGQFAINGQAIIEKKSIAAGSVSTRYETKLLCDIQTGLNGKFYFPSLYVTRLIGLFESTSTDDKNLIASVFVNSIEFDSKYHGINARLGGNTYFAGSMVNEYDGFKYLEQNFLDGNYLFLSETANAGMAAGTYLYTGIYEYIDLNGQVHRSAPFKIVEITTVGAHSVNVAYLSQSVINASISAGVKKPGIIIYRTVKDGTTFYRLGGNNRALQLYGPTTNPYEDSISDADLISSEQLYTSNGILDNDPLPPSKFLMVAINRIFSISSEDENLIYYSQPYLEGECVNFSDILSMRIDAGLLSKSGKGEALATIDDKIIILKDKSIAWFSGKGPNQAGLQNDFTDPKLIASDVGIADVKSIVSIPDGIMFKSNKGIYLLDRSLQLTYIGFQVEDYNDEEVVGAVVIEDKHMALFMTTSRTMVYDFLQKKWMIWTISGKALASYQGKPVYIDNDNRIRLYNPSSYLDGSTRYSIKLVTPWIKLSGIQNFQRIYKLMILGSYYSQHVLNVKSYYDYDETDFDSYVVSPLVTDNIYQYDVSIVKQKGQAMKFEISDASTSGINKSFKLSNLTMILGQKKGTNKTPDTRKY